MYAKLIFKNAKRSVKDYLIYIVTMTLCVTLFYAFLSISSTHYHPTIGAEYNISLLAGGMKLAICGISLLLLFLIHYVNRFMLRKKQKEFAVEATLGMEQKTIGLLFFGETFFLLIFSVSVGILLGMVVSQVITAMLLASFGEPYAFSWSFFPDTVLLTVGFFVVCQILVGVGNVRILNKSRIIELMTANRQNEKPLHKSRWMPMICIFYGILLLWMLEGLHRLLANRYQFTISERSIQNLEAAMADSDNLTQFMQATAYVRFKPDTEERSTYLYRAYTKWCEDNLESPVPQKKFSQFLLKNAGKYGLTFSKHIEGKYRGFRGVCVHPAFAAA